ncbi:phosphonate C-P lyase system protein PhnG [Serratia ureilytica]|nr:phosphonate C-P lyase system protein PhnG [Serratia ureilytica]
MQALESRQRWMSVLAHRRRAAAQPLAGAEPQPGYRSIRAAEIGLAQLQGAWRHRPPLRIGGHDGHRAVVQLDNGGYGYSYIAGRTRRTPSCARWPMRCCNSRTRRTPATTADRAAGRAAARTASAARRAIARSRVDFFTLVRGIKP